MPPGPLGIWTGCVLSQHECLDDSLILTPPPPSGGQAQVRRRTPRLRFPLPRHPQAHHTPERTGSGNSTVVSTRPATVSLPFPPLHRGLLPPASGARACASPHAPSPLCPPLTRCPSYFSVTCRELLSASCPPP